jgi:hypothetical protein
VDLELRLRPGGHSVWGSDERRRDEQGSDRPAGDHRTGWRTQRPPADRGIANGRDPNPIRSHRVTRRMPYRLVLRCMLLLHVDEMTTMERA